LLVCVLKECTLLVCVFASWNNFPKFYAFISFSTKFRCMSSQTVSSISVFLSFDWQIWTNNFLKLWCIMYKKNLKISFSPSIQMRYKLV
jgi:hypothetical protein